jgi:hypothetical protein
MYAATGIVFAIAEGRKEGRVFLQRLHKTATCRERRYQWLHTYTIYIIDLLRMSGWLSKHVEKLNFM